MALPLIAAGVSLAGGIIGGLTRNASYDRGAAFRDQDEARQRQLAMFADPNSPYYQQSTANFQRQLTDASPTINSLLGVSMALGGNYGGSQVLATKQREATERRNRESAGQFAGQLYGQGLQHTRGIWQDWVNARMQGYAA
ncbi:MAG: hypothetical protein GY865_18135, partial [candidate division Zixibacteria bacterium]|nr:hypothetical protein [candidate division Zixibacteria bacterium]